MSWLARSIAGGLRLDAKEGDSTDDDDDNRFQHALEPLTPNRRLPPEGTAREEGDDRHGEDDASDIHVLGRVIKEDYSKFNYSLSGKFRGLAAILDPPPPPPPPPPRFGPKSDSLDTELGHDGLENNDNDEKQEEEEDNDELGEDNGQLGELEGFLPPEDYYSRLLEEAVGVTEEVLAFARNIAHHPETWLDFPIEEEEFEDFDITDAQYNHLLAIEHLAPRLAALRIEFCPIHMSEGYFWMVYFVLLLSRLNKHDADLLSSPQVMETRGLWRQELEKQTKGQSYRLGTSNFNSKDIPFSPHENFLMYSSEDKNVVSDQNAPIESSSQQITAENVIEKHLVNEIEFIDKTVIREDPSPELQDKEIVAGSSFKTPAQVDNDEDDDDWLTEDSDLICLPLSVNEEEISFSDLEDDLDSTMPSKWRRASTQENEKTSKVGQCLKFT